MTDRMILESIVTSVDAAGKVNVAPMGPNVDRGIRQIVLKPFKSSTTYANLQVHPYAVVHVVDDVLLLARAAIGRLDPTPRIRTVQEHWHVLVECCRWFAIEVREWDDDPQRPSAQCEIVTQGTEDEFFGFNRAKHAVVELAILATRVHLLPADRIADEMKRLFVPVEKTGGEQEHLAFATLREYILDSTAGKSETL